ncbi:xanthine dehydrogenase accessory protein XdhC [Aestuariivirga sp.]|uniref:xanthine dehydrogenase accessory protein XdhC n=1 Tax=Aestuariivirga sp. TaxID=2650926 RepID=UPI003593EEE4
MKVWPLIERALVAHGTCAMVSVVKAEGSVPREQGARMVVTPEGFHGTIGGGTLEWRALAAAQSLLEKPRATKIIKQSLGPDLGQCCGGRVVLAVESFERTDLIRVQELAAREEQGPFMLRGRIAGLDVTESFGEQRRNVLVFGAGHVGRALVLALASLPFDVTWADPRPESFPSAAPSNVTIRHGDPLDAVAAAPPGSLAFVMSHSHALDLQIVDAALRNPNFAHVAVIGSATKRARFEKRLRDAGVEAERVAGLICPIGIGGIRSKLAAAIAVATAAQIITLDEALRSSFPQPLAHQRTAG